MAKIDKVLAFVSGIGLAMAVIAILVMTLAITANVTARTIADVASIYVEEYSGYLFVILAYLGFTATLRSDRHITVDVAVRRLSRRMRQYVELVATFVSLVCLCYLLAKSVEYVAFSLEMGVRSYWISRSLMWPLQMFVPIGLLMFLLQMVWHFIRLVTAVVAGATEETAPAKPPGSGE